MSKEQTIAALAEEIARLRALPDEPCDENGDGVVFFTKKFAGSGPSADVTYRYAAVRVPAMNKWYVTQGANNGYATINGFTWEALLEHIKNRASEYEIWYATSYEQIDV